MSIAFIIRLLRVSMSALSLVMRVLVIVDNIRDAWRAHHAKPASAA